MKIFLILAIFFTSFTQIIEANNLCQTDLFKEKVSTIGKTETVEYGEAVDAYKQKKQLHLLIHQPKDKLFSGKRPLIIFVHPGGFMECQEKIPCYEASDEKWVKPEITTRGFVTASVEYRLNKFSPTLLFNEDDLIKAHLRAIQDVRNAVKFIFDNADKYNIDKDNIFLAGYSAGAISILHSTFLDENETLDSKFEEKLAPRQKIKALISISGSIYNLDFIDANEKVPTLLIHGTDDFVVPFKKGRYFSNFWLTPVFGSYKISERMTELGFSQTDLFIEGMGHDFNQKQREIILQGVFSFARTQMGCQESAIKTTSLAK